MTEPRTAMERIEALERRVQELERQLHTTPMYGPLPVFPQPLPQYWPISPFYPLWGGGTTAGQGGLA